METELLSPSGYWCQWLKIKSWRLILHNCSMFCMTHAEPDLAPTRPFEETRVTFLCHFRRSEAQGSPQGWMHMTSAYFRKPSGGVQQGNHRFQYLHILVFTRGLKTVSSQIQQPFLYVIQYPDNWGTKKPTRALFPYFISHSFSWRGHWCRAAKWQPLCPVAQWRLPEVWLFCWRQLENLCVGICKPKL